MSKLSTIQKNNKLNEVYREGEVGAGNAYHTYTVKTIDNSVNVGEINFQNGARKDEKGLNRAFLM